MITSDQLTSMQSTVEATFDREAIVRTRTVGAQDDYGNPVETYTAGDPIPCGLVHRAGRETTSERDTQITDWTGRFPYDTVLSGRDLVRISGANPADGWEDTAEGATYEVVGPPERLGTHVHAELMHIEGG